MKKMKRLLVAMLSCLTAFACVAGLAACGDDDSSSSSKKPANSSSSAVISSSSSSSSEEESSSSEHVHSYEEDAEQSVAPTCTTAGKKVKVCECGDKIEEEIEALDHDFAEVEAAVEATCTEAGKTATEKCSRCEATQGGEEIAAPGHTEEAVADVEATCTEAGLTGKTVCSVCNEVINEGTVVEALGHNYEVLPEECVAATCTEVGKLVKACTVCGDKIEEEIELLAHDYVVDEEQSYAARCEADGKTVSVCSVCNTVKEEVVPMTGHNYEGDWEPLTDATCTVVGTKVRRCSHADAEEEDGRCSSYETYILPMLEHEWTEVAKVEPTCTTTGWTSYLVCAVCGGAQNGYRGEEIPALGHDLVETAQKDATCTEVGKTDYKKCSVCGYEEGGIEIPVLPHDFSVVVAGKVEPTCTSVGYEALYKCANCDATQGGEEIAKLAHTEEAVADVEATCTATGWAGKVICSTCGETLVAGEEVEAFGHNIVLVPQKITTCTEWGTNTYCYACTRCGINDRDLYLAGDTNYKHYKTPTNFKEVQCYGHKFKDGDVPTCTNGVRCERCKLYITTPEAHQYIVIAALAPTCTTAGWTEYRVCRGCGDVKDKVVLPATGHKFAEFVGIVEPGCETVGYGHYRCTNENCGTFTEDSDEWLVINGENHTYLGTYTLDYVGEFDTENYVTLKPLGHSYTILVEEAVAPTCTAEGLTALYQCERCEAQQGDEVVAMVAHKYVDVAKVEATCEADGHSAYKYCSECGDTVAYDVYPATGHNLKVTEGQAPTCTANGYAAYSKCQNARCEYKGKFLVPTIQDGITFEFSEEKELNPAEKPDMITINGTMYYVMDSAYVLEYLGHNIDENASTTNAHVDPTCTTAGKTISGICTVCGKNVTPKTIPALGHDFDDSCSNPEVTCNNGCGVTKKHACKFVETHARVGANCESNGNYAYKVCECGQVWIQLDIGGAYACVKMYSVTVEEVDGVEVETKTPVDYYTLDDVVRSAVGHDYSVLHEAKDSTCTEEGYNAYYTCSVCGKVNGEITTIDKLAHSSEKVGTCGHSTCDTCGQEYEDDRAQHVYDTDFVDDDYNHNYEFDHCIICGKEHD